MRDFYRALYLSSLFLLAMTGCESSVDTNENASGSTPAPNQATGSENDNFLNANTISIGSSFGDSVSLADPVDYFYIQLPLNSYRSYQIQLTGLSADADVELYNAYLNRESWSENSGTTDEIIQYWRDYTDLDNNIIFLKVIHRDSNNANYTLSVN